MSRRVVFAVHVERDPLTAVFRNTQHRAVFLNSRGHRADIVGPADMALDLPRLRPLLFPLLLACSPAIWRSDVVVFHSHAGWAINLLRGLLPPTWRPRTITGFHGLEPLYHAATIQELSRTGERQSWRFRLLHHWIVPRLLAASCRRSDAVFCLNRTEAAWLARHGWSDSSRIAIVANGVEPDLFLRRAHQDGGRRLLFVGQWLRPKGTRYLVAAFDAIAARRADAELVCAGTGLPADMVLAAFPSGLRHRIRVRPRVTRDELRDELRAADVFLFPSLSEGFSGALLEAMAAGLAIAATPAGAAADLLVDRVNALVVPPANAEALASAAIELLENGVLRHELGTAAHCDAQAYTWDAVNEAYASLVVPTPMSLRTHEEHQADADAR
jgi:glycosyltransferase involved in cell wall biosynthesis